MKKYHYIGFDENGSPYIAHAVGIGKGFTPKYLMKIKTSSGVRYFYTKQEIENYYRGLMKLSKGLNTGNLQTQMSKAIDKQHDDKWQSIQNAQATMDEIKADTVDSQVRSMETYSNDDRKKKR